MRPGWARRPERADLGGDGVDHPALGLGGPPPVDGHRQPLGLDQDTHRGAPPQAGHGGVDDRLPRLGSRLDGDPAVAP